MPHRLTKDDRQTMKLIILDRDGVINHDSDRENESQKRDRVEREAKRQQVSRKQDGHKAVAHVAQGARSKVEMSYIGG